MQASRRARYPVLHVSVVKQHLTQPWLSLKSEHPGLQISSEIKSVFPAKINDFYVSDNTTGLCFCMMYLHQATRWSGGSPLSIVKFRWEPARGRGPADQWRPRRLSLLVVCLNYSDILSRINLVRGPHYRSSTRAVRSIRHYPLSHPEGPAAGSAGLGVHARASRRGRGILCCTSV